MKTPGAIATDALTGYPLGRDITREDVWQIVHDAIEEDREQGYAASADESSSIYWTDAPTDSGETYAHLYGAATAAIVDEAEGGIIAYTHAENAPRVVAALRGARS